MVDTALSKVQASAAFSSRMQQWGQKWIRPCPALYEGASPLAEVRGCCVAGISCSSEGRSHPSSQHSAYATHVAKTNIQHC